MIKIFAVKTEKYKDYKTDFPFEVTYLEQDIWPMKRQWNKLHFFELPFDEPIVVIDLDTMFINDWEELINYPCERDEFVSIPAWWKDTHDERFKINGGFYKFWPTSTRYIADKFREQPRHWREHYFNEGITNREGFGEQYFVEESARERLKIRLVPATWVTKWTNNGHPPENEIRAGNEAYPGEYLFDGKFNPDIKMIHFLNQF